MYTICVKSSQICTNMHPLYSKYTIKANSQVNFHYAPHILLYTTVFIIYKAKYVFLPLSHYCYCLLLLFEFFFIAERVFSVLNFSACYFKITVLLCKCISIVRCSLHMKHEYQISLFVKMRSAFVNCMPLLAYVD